MERRYIGVADAAIYLDMTERWMYRRVPTARHPQVLLRRQAEVPRRRSRSMGAAAEDGVKGRAEARPFVLLALRRRVLR